MTTNSQIFRDCAAKCLQVAEQADVNERVRLMQVATGWIKLADEADAERVKQVAAEGWTFVRRV
jgi:hypothetical protein